MRYYNLLAAVSFAGFAAGAVLAAAAVVALWRRRPDVFSASVPQQRAARLLALRLAPVCSAVISALLLALAFLRYEPAATRERPGLVLLGVAGVGLAFWLTAYWRAALDLRRMARVARIARLCPRAAFGGDDVVVVEAAFPVAAVAGWWRPRVLLSSRILAECSAEEIDLIVAHERAHIHGRDNIVRALLRCLPDPLGATRAGLEIEHAWTLAVEEAADDQAAGDSAERRATLASALVRVAGLADGAAPAWMPTLAFYQGEHLRQRVTALLARRATARPRRSTALMLSAGVGLFVAAGISGASTIHRITEWIVRSIP